MKSTYRGDNGARRSASIFVIAALAFAAASPAVETQPAERRDEPRRIDGRVEPTINPAVPAYADAAERLALIEAANQLRNELAARFPIPVAVARHTGGEPITLDGLLDEPAWRRAQTITNFRDTRSGEPASRTTVARVLWDDERLYIAFECEDAEVVATLEEHDAELWREDAVEVFIDANADGMSYIELEASPLGTRYDAALAEYRPEVTWDVNSPHLDVPGSIGIYRAHGFEVAAHVDGTLNDPAQPDKGWTCELSIPWTDIARGTNVNALPPRDGEVWRIGLYHINIDPGSEASIYAAWSPTGTWFHRPWQFGRVVFVQNERSERE